MTERTYFIARAELAQIGLSPKAVRQFEDFQLNQAQTSDTVQAQVEGTEALRDATFVTLSPNAELPNERVLTLGDGLSFVLTEGEVKLETTGLVRAAGGHEITFVGAGASEVVVPLAGTLATREAGETLENKTLDAPFLANLVDAADDAAAATGGVEVGQMYRNGSALQVRVA